MPFPSKGILVDTAMACCLPATPHYHASPSQCWSITLWCVPAKREQELRLTPDHLRNVREPSGNSHCPSKSKYHKPEVSSSADYSNTDFSARKWSGGPVSEGNILLGCCCGRQCHCIETLGDVKTELFIFRATLPFPRGYCLQVNHLLSYACRYHSVLFARNVSVGDRLGCCDNQNLVRHGAMVCRATTVKSSRALVPD